MTEEIIIDGVNVAGCISFDKNKGHNICCYDDTREDKIPFANLCVENKYCYYKQLKLLEQENKGIKEAQKGLIKRITYFENVIQKTFNCLINANAKGKITDTLWVSSLTTLWDMLASALKIENIEEYENEVLNEKI